MKRQKYQQHWQAERRKKYQQGIQDQTRTQWLLSAQRWALWQRLWWDFQLWWHQKDLLQSWTLNQIIRSSVCPKHWWISLQLCLWITTWVLLPMLKQPLNWSKTLFCTKLVATALFSVNEKMNLVPMMTINRFWRSQNETFIVTDSIKLCWKRN